MLTTRATEGDERVPLSIDAITHAEILDGKRHARVGDVEKRFDQREFSGSTRASMVRDKFTRGPRIKRHREEARYEAACKEIHIRDGERTTAAVTRGTRIRARAVGTDFTNAIAHATHRTATRSNRINRTAWCRDRCTRDARFGSQRNFTVARARDIAACSTHVKAHDFRKSVSTRNRTHRACATSWS